MKQYFLFSCRRGAVGACLLWILRLRRLYTVGDEWNNGLLSAVVPNDSPLSSRLCKLPRFCRSTPSYIVVMSSSCLPYHTVTVNIHTTYEVVGEWNRSDQNRRFKMAKFRVPVFHLNFDEKNTKIRWNRHLTTSYSHAMIATKAKK